MYINFFFFFFKFLKMGCFGQRKIGRGFLSESMKGSLVS